MRLVGGRVLLRPATRPGRHTAITGGIKEVVNEKEGVILKGKEGRKGRWNPIL